MHKDDEQSNNAVIDEVNIFVVGYLKVLGYLN